MAKLEIELNMVDILHQSMVNNLTDLCHKAAVDGGWWHDINTGEKVERNKGELIALCHSELSECLEGVRKGCMDDKLPHRTMEEVELADTLIRIFDYAGAYNLDLGGALVEKIKFNRQRAIDGDHSSGARQAEGGKKF